jgi:hypothetical protein
MCPPFLANISKVPNLGKSEPGVPEATKINDITRIAGPQRQIHAFISVPFKKSH